MKFNLEVICKDEGPKGWEAGKNDLTMTARGTMPTDILKALKGARNEDHKWWDYNGEKWFGNYPKRKWHEFVGDIKENGIKSKIMLYVEKDGRILIGEGNHRVKVALELGIPEIPVDIRFFGNSQQHLNIQHFFKI